MAATEKAAAFVLCSVLALGEAVSQDLEESPVSAPSGTRIASKVAVYSDDDGLTVVTPIVSVKQKIFDATEIGVEYDADILTAATVDVRTSATGKFKEVRHGVAVSGTQRVGSWDTDLSASAAYSHEADYRSITLGGGFSSELIEKNLTVGAGYSFVDNEVGRSGTPFDNFSDSSHIHAASVSITQIVSKRSFVQLSGSLIGSFGYQASVYRFVPIFLAGTVDPSTIGEASLLDGTARPVMRPAERLPGRRFRGAGVARINQQFDSGTTLAADYRLYGDDWGVTSHTVSLAAYQHLPLGLTLRLRNRLYLQNPADFVAPVTMVDSLGALPEYYTTDRELGDFWYDLAGLKLTLELARGSLFERATFDLGLDMQYTRYASFPYLAERTAWIWGGGMSFEL
ncbi:MAG: DUF3570 domain-containing protein [Deltaproteobacteria bacterium]|nr:DUF3570 domain-containing protein [Deltaproteobacteria bacterium]